MVKTAVFLESRLSGKPDSLPKATVDIVPKWAFMFADMTITLFISLESLHEVVTPWFRALVVKMAIESTCIAQYSRVASKHAFYGGLYSANNTPK